MAKIHKGSHGLKKQAWRYLLMSGACLGLVFAYAAAFISSSVFVEYALLNILPVALLGGMVFYYRRYKNFLSGAVGENYLLAELRRLPNSYHVFTNFIILDRGVRDEADFVIVGETGVFVIEAKNYCGELIGRADDSQWQQHKLVKGGKMVVKAIVNPVKQTNRHAFNLAKMLRNHGFSLYVNGILAFTSQYVQVTAESDNISMIKDCQKVNAAILNHHSTAKLDKNMIKDIVRTLSAVK